MANVLGTLFSDIANAIREKTGEEGTMKPKEFPEKIAGIEAGGNSADVRYVTFMNGDTVHYVKPVAVGDDCVDVVLKGLAPKPTKESTVAQVFDQSGWALIDGGDADSNALKNVTEDRTVYAAYTTSAREYTVNFYDGDTLLESKLVPYGSTPVIDTPFKEGYSFTEWQPAVSVVTGDADYYAQWSAKTTFAGGSWADIAAISEAGEAADYFAIGDTKTITVGDTTMELILIGFNHDDLADGSGKAGMTIVATTTLANTVALDNWSTLASTMRTTLKSQLPTDLQSVIKSVHKPCDVSGYNKVVTPVTVAFDLFPLSMNECKITVNGNRNNTQADWENYITTLGTPYEYFVNKYNSAWGGPYGTFLGSAIGKSLGCWFRQWFRFTSTPTGVYHNVGLYTTSKMYVGNEAYTNKRTVMIAFCI